MPFSSLIYRIHNSDQLKNNMNLQSTEGIADDAAERKGQGRPKKSSTDPHVLENNDSLDDPEEVG